MICSDRYRNTHRLMQKFCILTAVLWSTQNDGVASFGALSLLVEWQKGHLDSAIIPQKSLPKVVKKEKPGSKWWATCCSPKTDIKTTVVVMTNEGVRHLQWTANKVFGNLRVRSNYFPDCIQKGIQPDEKFCSNHPPTSREQLANQTSRNITEKLVHKHVCCVGENIF